MKGKIRDLFFKLWVSSLLPDFSVGPIVLIRAVVPLTKQTLVAAMSLISGCPHFRALTHFVTKYTAVPHLRCSISAG